METRLDVCIGHDKNRLLIPRIEGNILVNTSIKLKWREREGEREREEGEWVEKVRERRGTE